MVSGSLTRRGFIGCGLACATGVAVGARAANAKQAAWAKFDSYVDEKTGARVFNLTPGEQSDSTIYQTHPMWPPEMKHFVFMSNRSSGTMAPHVLDMNSREVRPLLPEGRGGDFVLTHRGADVFWLQGRDVMGAPIEQLMSGDASPSRIGALPDGVVSTLGMMSVDAAEAVLYTGAVFETDKMCGIIGMDLKSGQWETYAEVDFQVGHVQANPVRKDRLLFCHETGGFADQRTWLLDVAQREARPFYISPCKEWVTHEVWWGGDHVLFTVWPYDEEHKKLPHGVCLVNGEGKDRRVLANYPAWHTHGSPDMRWVMGDDFERNLWLIDPKRGERRLLTQGHNGEGKGTHPHASFTPDSRGIVFNSSRSGNDDILIVELPAWDSLK